MKKIPYGRQEITEEDVAAVVSSLHSDFLTQGPRIEEFEKKFAEYIGAPYTVAVTNGTAALHLAALALGLKAGQKVITSPITFSASANCVAYCGAEISFVDIDPKTYLLDLKKLRALLGSSPKNSFAGIIPVDFAGLPVNLEELRSIADEYGLWILEDACHSPGAFFLGKDGKTYKCGDASLADAAVFSFHPVKHIACGEGGMITTASLPLYEKLLDLRTHGITKNPKKLMENPGPWYYEMQLLGFNYRLTDIQAALGISQLKRVEQGFQRRKYIAKKYIEAFKNTVVRTPFIPEDFEHAWHLFVIQVSNRKELFLELQKNQIFTQVHYIPVHLQPYYKNKGFKKGMYPVAEDYYEHCLSLPMFPSLTDEEQDFVIKKVLEFAK